MKSFVDKDTGLTICSIGSFNKVLFLTSYYIDDCDHSCLEIKLLPQQEVTSLFLHVLIGNVELLDSPKPIEIVKSQKHLDFEKEEKEKK